MEIGTLFEDIYKSIDYINVKELGRKNKIFKMAIVEASLPIALKLIEKS